jgi:hypothetical protein
LGGTLSRRNWTVRSPARRPPRIAAMKKLLILALIVVLGVVAARRLRES